MVGDHLLIWGFLRHLDCGFPEAHGGILGFLRHLGDWDTGIPSISSRRLPQVVEGFHSSSLAENSLVLELK